MSRCRLALTDDERLSIRRARRVDPAPTPTGIPASLIALIPEITALLTPRNRPRCPVCSKRRRPVRMDLRLIGTAVVWTHCRVILPVDRERFAAFLESHGLA